MTARRLVAAATLAACASPLSAAPALDPVFSDHAVIQRERPIIVRGTADPGERLTVTLRSVERRTRADRQGRWQVELPAMKAGGPYTLTVGGAGGAKAQAKGLLVGDVWLCSGQSNMEWSISQSLNGGGEVQAARDPEVRILTVPQRTSLSPGVSLPAATRWQVLTPETAAEFSAVCWFMVRELKASAKVPMGMIDSSWGGTRIRPWLDATAVRAAAPADADLLALYQRDPVSAARRFGEQWGAWWRSRTGEAEGTEPWRDSRRLEWRPFKSISAWEGWGDPAFAEFNGYIWARRKVRLTAAEASGGATLSLGVIDDLDHTWVNGIAVGSQFGWSNPRDYALPPGVLKAGDNEIVVNIGDSWGFGGFQGPADRLKLTFADGREKPLGEGWEYSVVTRDLGSPPRAPWDTHAGVSVIYNAMIAPLGPIGVKGVAWYQGESDVGVPGYDRRLEALMAGWRRQFRNPKLPFVIVGLANFGAPHVEPRPSGWAELRNEQRLAADRDPDAALVVAMDLGERGDIHPPNKQDVGRRAARAAHALAYGGKEPASGPEIAGVRREGGGVVLDFRGVTGRLRTYSSDRVTSLELCGAAQESCRWAEGRAEGTRVRIRDDGRLATRVRYGWGETPVTNLYDEAGLPAGPFEVPIP
jgi:sialate O-acetylesterase